MSAIDSHEVSASAARGPRAVVDLAAIRRLVREGDVRAVAVGAYALFALVILVLVVSAFSSGGAPTRSAGGPSLPAADEPAPQPAKPVERTAAANASDTKRTGDLPPKQPAAQEVPPAGGTHAVSPGDTLSAIAGRYGTTIDELLRLNPGIDPYALKSGQLVRIP